MKKMRVALALLISAFTACFVQAQNVAKVGNTEYATIDEAIAAWTNGSTLTLLADVTLSKTIEINSNESRTLDLGTYTMTAAKNKDAIQYVVKGRTSLGVALEIKADATNPGGITASGKAIVVHTKPLMSAPSKDRPITSFYGGVFNASNIVKQGGTFGAGYTGASAPSFYFYGGVFNGSISTNRSLNQFHGGTFNGKLQMSVDSSAYTLIAGGRFKYLSNLQSSELNSDKFTIGSEKGKYDRGIYVDKDGYYVITSAPITEVSAKYKAVKKESYNSNNYFCYSAAATYGMFYEVASMAGTGSNVTVYAPKVSVGENVAAPDGVSGNLAVEEYDVVTPADVKSVEITLTKVEGNENEKVVFTVEPKAENGEKVSEPTSAITFRLPVPSNWTGFAKVYHDGKASGIYSIQNENGDKFVEISSAKFSEFAVELADVELPGADDDVAIDAFGTNTVFDGVTYYATLQAAVEAVCGTAGATLYCKPGADVGSLQHAPVTATLTIYGNGAYVSGGSERDFDIGNTDPNGGRDITADMTLTVKDLAGCGAWGSKSTAHTVNLVFEDCANMGKVFITGTTGTLNITMTDCAFEGVIKEAVYSNADGVITLTNVDFSNLNKAINLNHKAAGTQTVTLTNCDFTDCGANVAADEIPVRVLSSVDGGKSTLTVSGCTFSGTPEGGADILLDYGVGETTANVSATAANVAVEKSNNVATTTTTTTNGSAIDFTNVVTEAMIGTTKFKTFAEALSAAAAMTGDVTVKILEKVTLNSTLSGSYTSIKFVGEGETAEIYLNVQGYIEAPGKKVAFKDLKLSKSQGGFIGNAGFMNVAFGVYNVAEVTYTNCTFLNGAYASSGAVTFAGCTFKRSHDKYGLWAYGNANITVDGCTFADYRGIKMYAENGADASVVKPALTVKNTNFSAVDNKPAIVLTYGQSVTLEGNTYSSKGVFELDLDGAPNGTSVTSDVAPTCVNDNGACGVLVDGKIYTTVAQAAAVATAGSNVTLLHNSAETVVLPVGVNLDKNGFEAAGVSVLQPVAKIGDTPYATLEAAINAAQNGETIILLADVNEGVSISGKSITLDLNGKKIYCANSDAVAVSGGAEVIIKNGTLESAGKNCGGVWVKNAKATLEDCTFVGTNADESSGVYASNGATVIINNCKLTANHYALIMMGANVTINGGTFTAPMSISANGSDDYDDATLTINGGTFDGGIYWPANGMLTINGGTFTADTAVYVKSGSLKINGGTFTGNGEAKAYEYKDSGFNATGAAIVIENVGDSEYDAVASVAIKGGTFTSVNNVAIQSVTAGHDGVEAVKNFISGGTFSSDVSNLCAPSFIVQGNGNGGFGVIPDPAYGKLAKIGDTYYITVAEALTAAKNANMTDVTITLLGETTQTTTDTFDLCYVTLFNSLTFNQADASKVYYIESIYTGARTNGGVCTFDGVNIVVTGQYMFEGNVKLSNNALVTSTAEANCFIYNGTTTIEPGSKLKGVIDDFRGGKVIVDGGKTDGTYNETPDMQDAILIVNWSGDSLTLKNGAYVKVNAANEVGRLTLNAGTSANITASKLEACQYISIAGGASMNLDAASLVTTKKITGVGTITIDATGFMGPAKTLIKADMSAFTDEQINVTGNSLAKCEATANGLVLDVALPGAGTEADPFVIDSVATLELFRASVNSGATKYNAPGVWVALGADIDMAGTEWTEGIGDGHEWSFDGNFDGKGHTIKNLTIKPYADANKYLCGGLFGYTYGAVTIKNVILENVTVDCGNTEGHNVGALVGFAYNNGGKLNVADVTVKNVTITAPNVYGVGAIVGYSYGSMGTIERCAVDGTTIKGYSFVGGITGYSYSNATITNCSVKNVTISGTNYSVGGIAGIVLAGNTISNCSVDATIDGQANVGAIVGALSTDTVTLDNCTATGSLPEVGGNYSNNAAFEARVGNKYYTSLADAIAAANAGDTITLVRDVTLTQTIDVAKSITINGNGKKVLPANVNQTYNSAFMVGDSGWGDDHGEVITVKNIVFEGWKTNYGVVRAQGVTLAMDGCEFNACSASNAAYAVLSLNFTDATITNTKFVNNSSRVIDVNYNGDDSEAVVTIEGCTFDGNTTTGAGIVMRSDGTIAVKNSIFKNNTVNTNGNGATIYVGFGSGNEVSGCLFENNRVMSSLATTKRFASAIFCDGCVVNGNIFGEGNTATRNGETIATVVAVGAYYGAADINGNYWMGKEPVPGVDYTIEYTRNPVAMETYIPSYSTDANGDIVLADQVTIGYVAKTDKYGYKTLAEAIAAANAGDTITLIRDITTAVTIKIEKSITINGNGKTLTYTGSDRAIDVPNNADATVNVTIKNLTVDCTASYCQRGINYNDDGALTLEGVTVKGTNVTYALNLPGSSDNATVVINDSALSGNIALNVWGENATITATNTVFTSVDNTTAENYTAIALNNDGTTSAEGTTVTINGGQIIALNEKGELSNAIRNATSTGTVNVSDTTVVNGNYTKPVAIVDYGTDQFYSCATLQQAIDKAIATKGSVKLLTDTEVSEIITINGAVAIDLNGKTVTGMAKKVFEVYANATIKNGTINGANRCVDTRKAVELILTDVTLVADQYTSAYGNPQPLTIGGSEDGTKVTMSNVSISARDGYGIITFVKTDLTATDSTISGYSALYVKPGSEESTFAFAKSALSGSTALNDVEGNSFSAIAIRANTVTVTMDADSTLTATGNFCHALSLGGSYEGETTVANASVTIAGTIDGNIFSATTLNSNTIKVKAEYADDLLAEGYCTGNADANGLVVIMGEALAKIGDTYYATVEEALAAASNGTKVTVMNREAAVAFGDKLVATGDKVGADAYDVASLLGGSFKKTVEGTLHYDYAFGVSNVTYAGNDKFTVTVAIKDADSTVARELTGRTLVLCMVVEGDESTPDVITEIKKVKPTFVAADDQVTCDVSVELPEAGEGKATYFTVKVTDEK